MNQFESFKKQLEQEGFAFVKLGDQPLKQALDITQFEQVTKYGIDILIRKKDHLEFYKDPATEKFYNIKQLTPDCSVPDWISTFDGIIPIFRAIPGKSTDLYHRDEEGNFASIVELDINLGVNY